MTQAQANFNVYQEVGTKIILGGIANATSATLTNPIDVVKVRLQLQSLAPSTSSSTRYTGFAHGLRMILKEEGMVGWSKGLAPSVLRDGSYSALRFGLYDVVKQLYETRVFPSAAYSPITPLYIKILAGATTGAVGSALANPLDVIKVRLQGDRSGMRYHNSMIVACRDIYRHDGLLKGFYRGVGPTTFRAMVLTATQLPSYDHMKTTLLQSFSLEEGFAVHMLASMFAGFMAATTSSPIDVMKTQIMNVCSRTASSSTAFHSSQVMRSTFVHVWQTEGIRGFFKGWLPNWFRLGPHTIISLLVYEELRAHMGLDPI